MRRKNYLSINRFVQYRVFANSLFFIVLFSLFTISCDKTSEDFVPGEVLIGLEKGVEKHEVKSRIEELNLEWKRVFENLGIAIIGVPVGEERYWAEKLQEETSIEYAQLNHEVDLRD
jgi:hypothetical protein